MVGGVYNLQGKRLRGVELELPRRGPTFVPTSSGRLDVVAHIGNTVVGGCCRSVGCMWWTTAVAWSFM